ncbi:hypothetical protein [Streptomyces chartreusis]
MSTLKGAVAPALPCFDFTRFAFAVVPAVRVPVKADFGPLAVTLLLPYPLFSLAVATADARLPKATRPTRSLYGNIGLSLLAAAGIAAWVKTPGILRRWGLWAIVQLAVGAGRRKTGGQRPLAASDTRTTTDGASFILRADRPGAWLA